MTAREEFWAKLDATGEEQIRLNLGRDVYGMPKAAHHVWATEWLRQHDQARSDASHSEQIDIARSAKDAAWSAANAAREAAAEAKKANMIATLALIAAIPAIAISIIAIFLG